MNTAASYPKPMRTIILNDFRRFWVLSLAEFLLLFLATTSVIIINYSRLQQDSVYLQATLNMSNLFMMAIVCVFAALAAVVVFRYIHLVNATTVCHSLPVTRRQLYTGHVISGYTLAAVPVILNSLILMLLAKPVYYDENMYYSAARGILKGRDMFTPQSVFVTMLLLLLLILIIYSISVFAGMLCGTSVMHVIGAFGLNMLVPAILAFVCEYAQLFLYGFSISSTMRHIIKVSAPIVNIPSMRQASFAQSDSISLVPVIIYLLVCAAVIFAGYLLYRQRKLENATEPLVFKVLVPVVCGLITFFAATLTGLFAGEPSRFFIWFIAGTVVFYILSRMLALKTTRVFNKSTFKALGIYAVIIAVFISMFTFDVTGYENRIPAKREIKSASTDIILQSQGLFQSSVYDEAAAEFTSEENIENMRKLHEELLSQKPSALITGAMDSYLDTSSASCSYTLKNGHVVKRSYDVSEETIKNSKALKAIYESAEFKEHYSLYNISLCKDIDKTSVSLVSYVSEEYTEKTIKVSDMDMLVKAMDKDFQARSFNEELAADDALGAIEFFQNSTGKDADYMGNYLRIPVLESDTNTIAWLKSHGYYTYIDASEYIVKKAYIYDNSNDKSINISKALNGMTLEEILNLYGSTPVEAGTYYELSLDLKHKDSSKTYYYSMSYSEETLPKALKKMISK